MMLIYQSSFFDQLAPVQCPSAFDSVKMYATMKHESHLDPDVENHGYFALGHAVLIQALQDAHDKKQSIRDDAREWLLTYGVHWAEMCGADFIDDKAIKRFIRSGKRRLSKLELE